MHRKIFLLILLDQITKLIFWGRDFFIGLLHIHPVKNFGIFFSFNFGLLNNLIIILAALGFFIYYYFKHRRGLKFLGQSSAVLIFAGAISNLADRIYLGYVRDFLDLGWAFTFNFADVLIALGLFLLLLTNSSASDKIEL
ncbi:MAG: hypothetical protein A3B10_02945 [Candidatus Doudnabacteria bacterium RIFCSPLOWO2_01_FULL_44_21]|uniref:Lipoprotein signal peptidase n=1 Tax=Candidatus Doudnabacteria bacterium RIFCSPLOWO2_01_FULL_44_21 TaxID=1817841 RepID=A0A1F5Q294_9BACT|nr:MAG: hypothetical protein A3B95_03210 [Candidatus Doudnabacteria bacterium RIFCSPHIGHO2_02_FULL_43_13b]OGE96244.1 MAG: hypothetical protein A3B10_02945 [Candidatus Doudnabacteria bacterium RIFCSPLOWO2_01_FULL_44_21]